MKIGITGGNGFIAHSLVNKHIELGDEVNVLSRNKDSIIEGTTLHLGDLLDLDSLVKFLKDVDVLYHCAAEIKDESRMEATNVKGTINLIKAASGQIKHWVQLSSVGVYGPIYSGLVTEEQVYNPINLYEKTKLESDMLVLEATKAKKFTSTIIRPSNVFGAKMKNQSLFELIRTIDKGLFFFIGKKGASANYVTVENVVQSLFMAGTNKKAINEIYNISDWCTIERFVEELSKHLQKSVPKFRIPLTPIILLAKITSFIPNNPLKVSRLNAFNNRSIYSTDKIEIELNYKPKNKYNDGLESLVKEYLLRKRAK